MHVHYPRRDLCEIMGCRLNVVSITSIRCCRHSGWISIDEEDDETQRGGIRMTGKVKTKYGRRAKMLRLDWMWKKAPLRCAPRQAKLPVDAMHASAWCHGANLLSKGKGGKENSRTIESEQGSRLPKGEKKKGQHRRWRYIKGGSAVAGRDQGTS